MKKPQTTSALAGDSKAEADDFKLTDAKLPLASEILLNLGALYAGNEVNAMMGEPAEAVTGRAVNAGIVAALHELLPPAQFRAVMIQWDVDAIKLSELLHTAGGTEPQMTQINADKNQPIEA